MCEKLLLLLVSLTIFVSMINKHENETNKIKRTVCLEIPGPLMDRIRAIQPKIGENLGLRTKAPQYAVVSEAVTLLEKKVAK